jgi:hypothetical protein
MRRLGCFSQLLLALVFGVLVSYAVVAITSPWAFHIGGQWTPVPVWWGAGKLHTKSGTDSTLFVFLYPSSHFSKLRMQGRRPSGGLSGSGCLCMPDGFQSLKISGTVYGTWSNADNSLVQFRLLEPTVVDIGQKRPGYFDLIGGWKGGELVMDDHGAWAEAFRSGLRVEKAAVTLRPQQFWTCKSACASAADTVR